MKKVIVVSPSLDTTKNVSGISTVVQYMINHNDKVEYLHFEQGRHDGENSFHRFFELIKQYVSWKRLLEENPDAIIHYNYPLMFFSSLRDYIFMAAAKKKKCKLLVHVHGGDYLMRNDVPLIPKLCIKKVFGWQVPVVVTSEVEKQHLEDAYGLKKVTVLQNCVDLQDDANFRHAFPSDNKPLTFGYLGRITKNKGIGFLLEACRKLKEVGVPFRFVMAGKEENKGEYVNSFKEVLDARFEFIGVVNIEMKKQLLRKMDVLVLPSFFEGLPMSLLECMAYGVVPLCTPVGSITTVLKDGESGLLLNVKDSDSIVKQMKYLHENRTELNRLSKNAHATIMKTYSPKKYAEILNELYEEA